MSKLKGLYILNSADLALIYGPGERADIQRMVDIYAEPITAAFAMENYRVLKDAEVIMSGWGAPMLDEAFLDNTPKLRAFFYGAGAVGHFVTPAVWERNIHITSAVQANSIPVAEYALSVILFSLKCGWSLARQTRELKTFVDRNSCAGCYGSTVGIVSMGTTARLLRKLLRSFDIRVIVYDPYLASDDAESLDIELVSLESLFEQADVVSLHTPLLPETERMITGKHLQAMKPGAAFVNTSRGTIVRQDELIEVARQRPDLQFVLDVAEPEPPLRSSLLYTLENVVLTPHIAGSAGRECTRMGRYMVEELERYIAGKPLKWEVSKDVTRFAAFAADISQKAMAGKPEVTTFVTRKTIQKKTPVGSP